MEPAPRPTGRPDALLAEMAWLRRLARSLTADPSVADDLVQETWLAAVRARPSEERPLRPWLSTVLRNFALQGRRTDARRAAREGRASESRAAAAPSAADLAARVEAQRLLAGMVLDLEEPLRTALLLRYYEDLPTDEIARRTAVRPSTVRGRVARGLDRLRERLDGKFGGDRVAWCLVLLRLEPEAAGRPLPAGPGGGSPARPPRTTRGAGRRAGRAAAGGAAAALLLAGGAALLGAPRGWILPDLFDGGGGDRAAAGERGTPHSASAAFPREAARRDGKGITANGAHPGDTEFGSGEDAPYGDRGAWPGDPGREGAAARGATRPDPAAPPDGEPGPGRTARAGPSPAGDPGGADRDRQAAADAHLRGRVEDPLGRPVAGARVRAFPGSRSPEPWDLLRWSDDGAAAPSAEAEARTDARGAFALSLPDGEYRVVADGPGLAAAEAAGRASEEPVDGIRIVCGPGATVEGRVVGPDGGPAPGLLVAARPLAAAGPHPAAGTWSADGVPVHGRTAPDGSFRLEGLPPGPAVLAVVGGEGPTPLLRLAAPAFDLRVASGGGGASLEGLVILPDGAPAVGAEAVVARLDRHGYFARAAADEGGRYSLEGLPAGPAGLFRVEAAGRTAHPEGFDPADPGGGGGLVLAPGRNRRDVILDGGAVVRGTVRDGAAGGPVAGARVTLLSPGAPPAVWPSAVTDADGEFLLAGAPPGTGYLVAARPGWTQPAAGGEALLRFLASGTEDPAPGEPIEVPPGEGAAERSLLLDPLPPVRGTVLGEDGRPAADARVRLVLAEEDPAEAALLATLVPLDAPRGVGAAGEFRIEAPPEGLAVAVVAEAPGRPPSRSEPFRVRAGTALPPLLLFLASAPVLEGRVVDDGGRPLGGATLRASAFAGDPWDRSADAALSGAPPQAAGPDGRFSLPLPARGDLLVEAAAAGFLPARAVAAVRSGRAPASLEMPLRPAFEVGGRVEDPVGAPVAAARVTLVVEDGVVLEARSGPSGEFRFPALEAGAWTLSAEADGFAPSAAVGVAPGDPPTVLRLRAREGVDGVVLQQGAAVAGALVDLLPAGPGAAPVYAVTDAAGRFAFRDLPDGAWTLRVVPPPGAGAGPLSLTGVATGTRELRVEVPPPPEVRVSVRGSGGAAAPGALVTLSGPDGQRTAEAGPDGLAVFRGPAPGSRIAVAAHLLVLEAPGSRHGRGAFPTLHTGAASATVVEGVNPVLVVLRRTGP